MLCLFSQEVKKWRKCAATLSINNPQFILPLTVDEEAQLGHGPTCFRESHRIVNILIAFSLVKFVGCNCSFLGFCSSQGYEKRSERESISEKSKFIQDPTFSAFLRLALAHRKHRILHKQSLKSCSVELILPQQPKAIRVTIHCRHSNQATGQLVVLIADNNSQVDPYVLSSMSANPTLIKVQY